MEFKCFFGSDWEKYDNIFVKGSAFQGDSFLDAKNLAKKIHELPQNQRIGFFRSLNGFYSAVYVSNKEVFGVADRVRSIPFFYSVSEKYGVISDDPYWIAREINDQEVDYVAKLEFLLTGYVTNRDTFCPNVKQIQAGEIFSMVAEAGDKVSSFRERYYRFTHKNYYSLNENELMCVYDKMLLKVFSRLTEYANGRCIVLPLSGGYDSRLIALMLKRLEYKNVITFTYGKVGNAEAKISKWVADSLNMRWYFIPYDNESWFQWFHSDEMKAYCNKFDYLCTNPHFQDWPAVKFLIDEKLIPADSVFVPGLSADLPSGGFSIKCPELYEEKNNFKTELLERLFSYQCGLWDKKVIDEPIKELMKKRIMTSLGDLDFYPNASSAFESWVANEKVGKFVNNSVRVYEFFGQDWWLPLWDSEFIDFWSKVSLPFRVNQSFYIKHIVNMHVLFTGFTDLQVKKRDGRSKAFIFVRAMVKKTHLDVLLRALYYFFISPSFYDSQAMSFYGCMNKSAYKKYCRKARCINTYLAIRRLGFCSFSSQEVIRRAKGIKPIISLFKLKVSTE